MGENMKKLLKIKNVGIVLFLLIYVVANAQEADTLAPEIVAGPDVPFGGADCVPSLPG